MTAETEQRANDLLDKFEHRNGIVLKLIYALIVLLLTSLIYIGIYIQKADRLRKDVNEIERNYIPFMFYEGLQKNQYFLTRDLVATFSGASKQEIDLISSEYLEFQKYMMDQMIGIKKAHSNTSRSAGKSVFDSIVN